MMVAIRASPVDLFGTGVRTATLISRGTLAPFMLFALDAGALLLLAIGVFPRPGTPLNLPLHATGGTPVGSVLAD